MESDRVRLRTYKQVWTQEKIIYQIERVRLPFPVTLSQASVFFAAMLVMAGLSRLPLIDALPPVARYVGLPALLAWFLTKQRLDGKPPLLFLWSLLRFLVSPKRLNRFQPLPAHPERVRYRGSVAYRLKG